MPRFKEERTWELMKDVPPHLFFLTREALSLRQKVVSLRQSLMFLQRCKRTDVLPSFITNKKIGATCGLPDSDPKIMNVYRSMLRIVIKEKQRSLYATLLKCNAKEQACRRLLPDRTWRRIEGGSRLICDSIRSKVKSTLLAKYDRLSSVNENTTARVTVLGNTQLSPNANSFLSLGPSFSPAQNINPVTYRKVVGGLQRLRDSLRSKTKRENLQHSPAIENRRLLPAIPFPRSLYKEPEPVREADIKFRILASGVLEVLNKFKYRHHTNLSRDQLQGFRELRELISNGSIRLSVSDKGGEFVAMPQELDRRITSAHLADATTYRPTTEKEFQAQSRRLNDIWTKVGKSAGLDDRFTSRLKLENPSCPVFYSLVKTHKIPLHEMGSMSADTFKIRPIISCVGGPTDRISLFLNKIVGQLITNKGSART